MCKWYLSTSSNKNSTTNGASSYDDQRTVFKGKHGSRSKSFQGKKASSSKLSKAKTRSNSKSLPIKKPPSSKHLTPKTGSSSKPYQAKLRSNSKDLQGDVGASAGSSTLLVPTKRPPQIRNCILGLSAVKTWALIVNKEFEIRKPEDVRSSADVARKGKKKMVCVC
ncbi:hypothetical protein Tco_0429256 [Tanacetum coccineum]